MTKTMEGPRTLAGDDLPEVPCVVNTDGLVLQVPSDVDPSTLAWGWRLVRPDLTSKHGFRWPFPGQWAEAPGPINDRHHGACPSGVGDGICVARTWPGATSGGTRSQTALVVAWLPDDVLGEEPDKVRVRRAWVAEVIDVTSRMVGPGANLSGADLYGANLHGANLSGANLYGANLSRADLSGANLYGANLSRADLSGANLSRADLSRADLSRADLYGANLHGADLYGANLYGADLPGANLYRALGVRLPVGWSIDEASGIAQRSSEVPG